MDALLEIFSWLIPSKDERLRRWELTGLFVALGIAVIFALVFGLVALGGAA